MNSYTVNVGNVGELSPTSFREAIRLFVEYKDQSKNGYGRASGENVTLLCNGEPVREYFSPYQQMRNDLESGECVTINHDGKVMFDRDLLCTIDGNEVTEKKALWL